MNQNRLFCVQFKHYLQACTTSGKKKIIDIASKTTNGNHRGPTPQEKSHWVKRSTLFSNSINFSLTWWKMKQMHSGINRILAASPQIKRYRDVYSNSRRSSNSLSFESSTLHETKRSSQKHCRKDLQKEIQSTC